MAPYHILVGGPSDVVVTDWVEGDHYMVVVLRDDQLDLIRQIVREELDRADAS